MAGNPKAAKEPEPVDAGVTNPSITGAVTGTQTIPGPKTLSGEEIKNRKESPNKKFHENIKKQYGEHVVHTRDKQILLNGRVYGPGLVNCGDEEMIVDGLNTDKPVTAKVSDVVRAAIDKYHSEPEEQPEEISSPMSPNDVANANQFTVNTTQDVTPRVGDEDKNQ